MKLYFSPFACSLASHIVAREAGLPLDLEAVTLATKKTASGEDYFGISPKGQVPALRLADGELLTENSAVLQFLADAAPGSELLPPPGSPDRYRVLEWTSFVATELHKLCFYPIFSPDAPAESKAWARSLLDRKLDHVASQLEGREFAACGTFTIADAYLTWALTLCRGGLGIELAPPLGAYLDRMQARPAVRAAIREERQAMAKAA